MRSGLSPERVLLVHIGHRGCEVLAELAGPRSFARGVEYAADGAVGVLRVAGEAVETTVQGTHAYRVRLGVDAGASGTSPSCWSSAGRSPCRHERRRIARGRHSLRPRRDADAGAIDDAWDSAGIVMAMRASIDNVGRVVVPKALRDALGLTPGTEVDISRYGAGLQLVPAGRTARLVQEAGVTVATGETAIDDQDVFGLIDAGRR